MTTKHSRHLRFPAGPLAALIAGALVTGIVVGNGTAQAAAIPEPATVFYGRITGTGSDQPFAITDGRVEWVIQGADGRALRLTAPIRPLKDSPFAYRLNVPHEALATGLAAGPSVLPLKRALETHRHLEVRVNGQSAVLAGPSGDTFDASQARRAATFLIDLEVPLAPTDSDGDGLPDWWQEKYEISDGATGDADGDGVLNGDEYRLGSDPLRDNRQPTLRSSALQVYADGTTGVALEGIDADSPPSSVVFTLTRAPGGGALKLRNANTSAASPDLTLADGARFTQGDILNGRLIYVHAGGALLPDSFEVTLVDENPAHAAHTAVVDVRPFRPVTVGPAGEPPLPVAPAGVEPVSAGGDAATEQRVQNYLLSRDSGFVIWDWSASGSALHLRAPSAATAADAYENLYVAQYGPDRGHVLIGGQGDNTLEGGMEADVLVSGSRHNTLLGHRGADRFVIGATPGGVDDLGDFSIAEADTLDLRRVLHGASARLTDYLRVRAEGNDVILDVEADGEGALFADRQIRLRGWSQTDVDLAQWLDDGRLLTGEIGLPPRITVQAIRPVTGESETEPGEFLLIRTGPTSAALDVAVSLGGTAANGSDYAAVPGQVAFRAGDRTARVVITPFADSQPETTEIVELVVVPGAGYVVGPGDRARVSITDWQATLSIAALEPFATLQPLKAGAFRVTSSEPVDRPLEVLLTIGGSAEAGVHYQSLRRVINFAAGQRSATVEVAPLAGALPSGGAVSVEVSIASDPAYRVSGSRHARVILVDRVDSLAAWRARNFPDNQESLAAFGARDPGGLGISLLARYALGLDPLQPDRSRIPRPMVRDGFLTIDLPREPAAADVEIVVEASDNLVDWVTSPARVQEVLPAGTASNPRVACYRTTSPITEAPRQFLRWRVLQRQ